MSGLQGAFPVRARVRARRLRALQVDRGFEGLGFLSRVALRWPLARRVAALARWLDEMGGRIARLDGGHWWRCDARRIGDPVGALRGRVFGTEGVQDDHAVHSEVADCVDAHGGQFGELASPVSRDQLQGEL
jgi:hypothetical protein